MSIHSFWGKRSNNLYKTSGINCWKYLCRYVFNNKSGLSLHSLTLLSCIFVFNQKDNKTCNSQDSRNFQRNWVQSSWPSPWNLFVWNPWFNLYHFLWRDVYVPGKALLVNLSKLLFKLTSTPKSLLYNMNRMHFTWFQLKDNLLPTFSIRKPTMFIFVFFLHSVNPVNQLNWFHLSFNVRIHWTWFEVRIPLCSSWMFGVFLIDD